MNRIVFVDDEPQLLAGLHGMSGIDVVQLLAEVRVRYPQAVCRILSGYREQSDPATLACLASKAERRDRVS